MQIDPTIATIWAEFSSTLQLVIKGIIIGIVVSAPMGPVGILCIQRTMHKGRNFGLATGAGAALSDFLYALITGSGMLFVMDFIERPEIIFWLKLGGSIILFIFGLHTLLSNPIKAIRQPSGKKGTLFHNFITSFFVTLSNPLIILLFIALYAQLTFTVPSNPFGVACGYLSIIGGAMLWWLGLTYLVTRMKTTFGLRGMFFLNRTIGTIVVVVSVFYAMTTVFRISLTFY
ncbi:lysine transporter LysE [Alloprevotella sp. OH1205_COT-284]|uniref:LysE family translocator n=1 Tax=Alloprevotella sp. OH1205_COT-284 TaxID=2491043 RepID=UPI000F5FD03E|nr:LysE family transporter [Alloprevotella sp. OH1205_COT-284]RRD79314.1 lysine transporter LysE [Alloprevotella sp. OH1205_COT-284]